MLSLAGQQGYHGCPALLLPSTIQPVSVPENLTRPLHHLSTKRRKADASAPSPFPATRWQHLRDTHTTVCVDSQLRDGQHVSADRKPRVLAAAEVPRCSGGLGSVCRTMRTACPAQPTAFCCTTNRHVAICTIPSFRSHPSQTCWPVSTFHHRVCGGRVAPSRAPLGAMMHAGNRVPECT